MAATESLMSVLAMSSLILAGGVSAVIAAVVAAVVAATTTTTQRNSNRDIRTQTTKDTMRRQDTKEKDAIGLQGQQDTNNK